MSIALPAFTPAQESLFLTLGGRALDSRNLRRTRVVFIPDEAGVGDDRPVHAVVKDPDEVVNVITSNR
jgi:hypothetical protein